MKHFLKIINYTYNGHVTMFRDMLSNLRRTHTEQIIMKNNLFSADMSILRIFSWYCSAGRNERAIIRSAAVGSKKSVREADY